MDKFLLKSFTQGLISIFQDLVAPLKLQLFILSIWKKATSNITLMKENLKTARSIGLTCLSVSFKPVRKITIDRELVRDFNRHRFKILQNLASEHIQLFSCYDFDKYALSSLVIDNLNEYPCSPADLKSILEMFKISNLNMHAKEFSTLFEAAHNNSAFNFLWIAFWIGAQVGKNNLVFSEQESCEVYREVGESVLCAWFGINWPLSHCVSGVDYREEKAASIH